MALNLSSRMILMIFCWSLAACGRVSKPPKEAAQSGHGQQGLTTAENVYCPFGYNYDSKFHQCFSEVGVIGPFSDEMMNQCRSFGGGEPCESLHWDRNFAQQLRGDGLCPRGTNWDAQKFVCGQGEHVFGPFTSSQHDSCLRSGGGVACETMRWSRSFFDSMLEQPGNDVPKSSPVDSVFEFEEPRNSEIVQIKNAWATFYRIPTFRDVGEGGVPLLDMTGRRLGPYLHAEDWCHASLEGSVRVLSAAGHSTVFNYIGSREERVQVDCSRWISLPGLGYSRFYKAKGKFGDGVSGFSLQPFRTIAVDPAWLKYGSLVYIPSARGTRVAMADGKDLLHDGYFFVADTGGALYGNHIDVFVGSLPESPFKFVKSSKASQFEIYLINNPKVSERLKSMHTANGGEN